LAFATFLVWRLRTGACGVGACGFWRYRMPPVFYYKVYKPAGWAAAGLPTAGSLEVSLVFAFDESLPFLAGGGAKSASVFGPRRLTTCKNRESRERAYYFHVAACSKRVSCI